MLEILTISETQRFCCICHRDDEPDGTLLQSVRTRILCDRLSNHAILPLIMVLSNIDVLPKIRNTKISVLLRNFIDYILVILRSV